MMPMPAAVRPFAPLVAGLFALGALSLAANAGAEERHLALMLQNDVFAGNDGGGYTNGFALSYLRSAASGEAAIAPHWLLGTVAPVLGVGPATMAVTSLNQIMVTPRDISRKIPNRMDAPYLGALWLRTGQISVRDDVADILTVNLGMIGPASGARQAQIFIHRITGSTRPEGWDSQVSNRALFGVERYRALRLAPAATAAGPVFDTIVLGGGAAGNLLSSLGGSVLLRYGSSAATLQRSYPSSVRLLARSSDPLVFGRGWLAYAGVHADHLFTHAGISNDLPPAGSRAELRESQIIGLAGLAYGWGDASLSFSLQTSSALTTGIGRRQAFGSLSYTVALR